MFKLFILFGLGSCLLAIILGAFGSHKLKAILDPAALNSFQVACDYQMSQGLGLIVVAMLSHYWRHTLAQSTSLINGGGLCILLGTLLFCGSIYLLSLTTIRYIGFVNIGLVTPLGGSMMIIGWACLLFAALTQTKF